jgi:hypothetical protein
MATAQKRQRRRVLKKGGRPLKQGVIRTETGRISRSKKAQDHVSHETARQNRSTAVNARMRHHGVSEAKANDPLYGFELGRLYRDKIITESQYKAGERFAEDLSRYYGLTGIAFPSARAQNLFAIKAHIGDESDGRAKAARAATKQFMKLNGILNSCGANGRQIYSTVVNVTVLDMETLNWPEHMYAMLRKGLNELCKHYEL